MHADARKLLWDARHAALRVVSFTDGKSFDGYRTDELLRSAVERQLGIVGEALTPLQRVDPATAQTIPDLRRSVGFRNVLVHAYASVDDKMVWGVVEGQLPALIATLDALLGPR